MSGWTQDRSWRGVVLAAALVARPSSPVLIVVYPIAGNTAAAAPSLEKKASRTGISGAIIMCESVGVGAGLSKGWINHGNEINVAASSAACAQMMPRVA